ncbi:MAG: hypothetical protein ACRENA_07900 [Vulcanimicrobiaceae bacterium]
MVVLVLATHEINPYLGHLYWWLGMIASLLVFAKIGPAASIRMLQPEATRAMARSWRITNGIDFVRNAAAISILVFGYLLIAGFLSRFTPLFSTPLLRSITDSVLGTAWIVLLVRTYMELTSTTLARSDLQTN